MKKKDGDRLQIYLIRHGEKDKEGKHLSQNGIKQSKLLAKELSKIKFNKIYSSDLERCIETTNLLNKKFKIKGLYKSGLREVKGNVKDFPKNRAKQGKFYSKSNRG